MRHLVSSSIMARTTLDIDTPILEEVRRVQAREGGSLGDVVSRLLAEALSRRPGRAEKPRQLRWTTRAMRARIDLADKEALYRALDTGEAD
jgi:hypothetical protein